MSFIDQAIIIYDATSSTYSPSSAMVGSVSSLAAWSSSGVYVVNNEVIYFGVAYVAIAPSGPTATTPDANPTAWSLVAGNATEIQGIPVNPTAPTHNGEILIFDSVSNTYIPGDPLVQGIFPEGHTATGINPVLVSGKGANGNQYDLAVDNTGHLIVNQGTSPWVVSLASTTITGTVAVTGTFWQSTQPVSIASTVVVAGNLTTNSAAPIGNNLGVLPAVASASAPTYIAGDQVLLSTDLTGALRVNVGSVVASNDITEWAGVILGSPSNYGTSPGSVEVIGVNAFITNTVPVTLASTTITGTVAVTQSTSPWVIVGTVASTQSGTWNVGLNAGTNVIGHVVTDSGSTTVVTGTVSVTGTFFQATQPVSGTVTANQGTSPWVVSLTSTTITGTVAVTQSTSPWVVSGTVTANIGTTNGLALDATVSALQVAQGSVTSGEKGGLVMGAVTTAAPSYTTAQTSPLSLTLSGSLRVDGSGVTQPISGAISFTAPQHVINDASAAVIGHVIADSGSTTAVTGNVTVVQPTGTNLHTVIDAGAAVIGHVIADSGSTTVVTGNVTVVQPTGTNLHAVLDTGANTVGKVDVLGNAGAILDAATGAAVPANAVQVGASDGTLLQPLSINVKGTQGARGLAVQALNDAGRTALSFFVDDIAGSAAEALATMSITKGAVAQTAATSYTVTAGKTLRLTAIVYTVRSSTNAQQISKLRIRTAASGITTASPIFLMFMGEAPAASTYTQSVTLPDYEIAGGTQIAMSHIETVTPASTEITVCLIGYEY
jgi:hypothetical protein